MKNAAGALIAAATDSGRFMRTVASHGKCLLTMPASMLPRMAFFHSGEKPGLSRRPKDFPKA